ncbi:hypothetical protein P4O66_003251 [Electrophorus voltai]|uniref:G-protein coupled receptors family 1 profile domain-containing protein n=1 Tax=Electrophorus voltai TaxID=2609070 RepID=A0AAD9DMJ8_9TELE|nr:hypothetical protein P4O66_003251 [Electrophorus voltai]
MIAVLSASWAPAIVQQQTPFLDPTDWDFEKDYKEKKPYKQKITCKETTQMNFTFSVSNGHDSFDQGFYLIAFNTLANKNYLILALVIIYLITLLCNLTLLAVVMMNSSLQNAKFLAICNLAIVDISISSVIIPQMVPVFVFNLNHISFGTCFSQMFFLHFFGDMESFSLALLAYDRLVAICFPLRYPTINTNLSMGMIIAAIWFLVFLIEVYPVTLASLLPYCNSRVVGSCCSQSHPLIKSTIYSTTMFHSHFDYNNNYPYTKELIVDCSKKQERHYQPVRISGTTVEREDSFRYLGVHISQDLSWSSHTNSLAKKTRQRLYHLRYLRDFRLPAKVLRNFYTCTIENILTGNITVWFGNSTKQDRQALQRVVRSAERITHLQTIYYKRCQTKPRRIVKDPTHPNNRLFSLLRSGRCFCSLKTKTERLQRSFFPQAIRALNQGN